MRRYFGIILVSLLLLTVTGLAYASSETARQTYQSLYDAYRQKYNDFKIAKNEYDKYQTLTAQNTAIDKTKQMLEARDTVLRAYLQFLNDKINENQGMSDPDRSLYQSLISNEVTFLDGQIQLIPSIGSIDDATNVSGQLESHYDVLQTSIRQTLTGLILGDLASFAADYDRLQAEAVSIVNQNRSGLPGDTIAVADRWLLSISNKRTLYQQKIDQITRTNAALQSNGSEDLTQQTAAMLQTLGEAKTDLQDGTSYMRELVQVLKYRN